MTFFQKLRCVAISAVFVFATCAGTLQAQAQSGDRLPPPDAATISIDSELSSTEETHPPLRLTPDKSRILTLDKNIERVIVGNEAHLNILMDTAKRLIVVPRIPGATHFTLLGENGEIIMQRHAIVGSAQEKYVRIRETCRGADGCMPVRMFYCPGACHEIAIIGENNTAFSGSIASAPSEENVNSGLPPTMPIGGPSGAAPEDEQ